MHYVSTRGNAAQYSFSEILLGGLADDGGLYLPKNYPQINDTELSLWRNLSYPKLACAVLAKFAPEIPLADLKLITEKTYSSAIFCHSRHGDAAQITPLERLEPGLYLQALSNGPTLAFKDLAMQLLGNLFEYALDKQQGELNIVGATSGDTGSAAEYAMRSKRGIRIFMLSPYNKMSAFQTAQMFSLSDNNIFNIAVEGVFDDCQDLVKAISNDLTFKKRQKIGTVNSINWARIVAQVVYYFKGYFSVTNNNAEKVSFTVPSGNFGNICAGHIARMMGLPIDRLVVATNENDVLDEFFKTGKYRVRPSEQTYHTSSPSMDISKASNFERFVFDLIGRDSQRLAALFAKVEITGGFDLSGGPNSDGDEFKRIAEFGFTSGKSLHADRLETIRRAHDKYGVIVDTHTADGIKVALDVITTTRNNTVPMIVLETALASKFSQTIREALGYDAPRPNAFEHIESLPQHYVVMPANVDQIKTYIAQRTGL
jgi:threonine synthase